MDIEGHTRTIWIVLGTLSGLGVIIAFIRTWAWFSKSGKDIIDLPVRFYSPYLYIQKNHHFFFIGHW